MKNGIPKEILIMVLLLVVIIFVLVLLLYDFIPGKNENIKSVEYIAENSVSDVLEEIKENTGVDVQEKNSDMPLKSYSVDGNDLDVYASENSYESGKSDPFAEESKPAEASIKTTKQNTEKQNQVEINTVKKEEKKEETEKKDNIANNISIVPKAQNVVEEKKDEKVTNTTSSEGVFFEKKGTK